MSWKQTRYDHIFYYTHIYIYVHNLVSNGSFSQKEPSNIQKTPPAVSSPTPTTIRNVKTKKTSSQLKKQKQYHLGGFDNALTILIDIGTLLANAVRTTLGVNQTTKNPDGSKWQAQQKKREFEGRKCTNNQDNMVLPSVFFQE